MRHGNGNIYSGAELKQAGLRIPALSTASKPMEKKPTSHMDSFHVLHKVPAGDSPYTRAKHVQLVDKDPCKAISLFWSAINTGDRVDSALKDMAVVMKQLNRAEEAVEAIKSFRHLCSHQAQEALDNVLLDLYKRCGRTDDQIELLQYKLKLIEEGQAFGGRRTKIARSQGKKFHVSIDQEKSRLLGNLAWAYIQKDDYQSAEALYRKALSIEPDNNKKCNLAICLIKTGRIAEARFLLQRIGPSVLESNKTDSYIKSYERACELLVEIESQLVPNADKVGKQADVDELNKIKPAESAVPARNSGTTPPPPIQRDSLFTLVDGNLNCMSEMSAMDRSGWTDHREEKRVAFINNLNSSWGFASPLTAGNLKAESPGKPSAGCSKEKLLSVKGNWKLGPETSVAGNGRCIGMVEMDREISINLPVLVGQWLQGHSKDSDDLQTSVTGSSRMTQVPLVFNNDEKTQADIAGKEEDAGPLESDLIALIDEKIQTPMSRLSIAPGTSSEWSESRDAGDVFLDQNFNTNIINCTPTRSLVRSPYNADCFGRQKVERVDLKGSLRTPPHSAHSSVSDAADYRKLLKSRTPFSTEWTSSARRSLSFGKQDHVEGCTTTLPKTVDIGDSGYLQAVGSGSNFGMDLKPKKRGNRSPNQRSWTDGDAFPDQNFNTNIIRCTPPRPLVRSLHYTNCFQQQKFEAVDLKGPPGTTPPYVTYSSVSGAADHKKGLTCTPSSTGLEWTPSARRSLSSTKKEQVEGGAATLPETVDISDCCYLQATGSGSSFEMDVKLRKQGNNRLRVFQEITLPDSPKA
ncbi:hypothetical protein AAC387_Pa07g3322 [Persea americana]